MKILYTNMILTIMIDPIQALVRCNTFSSVYKDKQCCANSGNSFTLNTNDYATLKSVDDSLNDIRLPKLSSNQGDFTYGKDSVHSFDCSLSKELFVQDPSTYPVIYRELFSVYRSITYGLGSAVPFFMYQAPLPLCFEGCLFAYDVAGHQVCANKDRVEGSILDHTCYAYASSGSQVAQSIADSTNGTVTADMIKQKYPMLNTTSDSYICVEDLRSEKCSSDTEIDMIDMLVMTYYQVQPIAYDSSDSKTLAAKDKKLFLPQVLSLPKGMKPDVSFKYMLHKSMSICMSDPSRQFGYKFSTPLFGVIKLPCNLLGNLMIRQLVTGGLLTKSAGLDNARNFDPAALLALMDPSLDLTTSTDPLVLAAYSMVGLSSERGPHLSINRLHEWYCEMNKTDVLAQEQSENTLFGTKEGLKNFLGSRIFEDGREANSLVAYSGINMGLTLTETNPMYTFVLPSAEKREYVGSEIVEQFAVNDAMLFEHSIKMFANSIIDARGIRETSTGILLSAYIHQYFYNVRHPGHEASITEFNESHIVSDTQEIVTFNDLSIDPTTYLDQEESGCKGLKPCFYPLKPAMKAFTTSMQPEQSRRKLEEHTKKYDFNLFMTRMKSKLA